MSILHANNMTTFFAIPALKFVVIIFYFSGTYFAFRNLDWSV